jgi:diguanylate cyclase (GGDEF)-like protein
MPTKVLIADDDAVSCRLVRCLLEKWDYQVLVASNGIDARRILHGSGAPRLAILDWMMPGLDGIHIIGEVRAAQRDFYTYILLLTAKAERADLLRGLDSGADDYLTKPFDSQQLRARLRVGERIIELQERLIVALHTSEFRARHDSLTGLHNRAATIDFLQRETARCERDKNNLAVLIIDADHFKKINDQYGHLAGDEVLKNLAQRIKLGVRAYDLVGRYGGEEFLVVAPNCATDEAISVAERIRAGVACQEVDLGRVKVPLTVSIGVTTINRAVPDLSVLLRRADLALYAAKEKGRNRVDYLSGLSGCTADSSEVETVRG